MGSLAVSEVVELVHETADFAYRNLSSNERKLAETRATEPRRQRAVILCIFYLKINYKIFQNRAN